MGTDAPDIGRAGSESIQKGTLHGNAAARYKSRLGARVNAMKHIECELIWAWESLDQESQISFSTLAQFPPITSRTCSSV
jgi:hypothetical protein